MAVTLTIDDLIPFAPNLSEDKADVMIADALALAARVAPCLLGDELPEADAAAAKAILRGAILRWNDQGTGEQPQLVAGIFQMNPSQGQPRRSLLLPSEIKDLTAICGGSGTRRAYMVDLIPEDGS